VVKHWHWLLSFLSEDIQNLLGHLPVQITVVNLL